MMPTPSRISEVDVPMKQDAIFYNPIQLAAISNFKLAQLTFAPPDLHSLGKTAVVKNMIESIYSKTPAAWLQQMTRWQFFTPESLEEMTQERLEEIFTQYLQTIEAFRPKKAEITPSYVDMFTEDIEDDLWRGEEANEEEKKKTHSTSSSDSSIFSQPNATITTESGQVRGTSPLSDKPLPAHPMTDDRAKQARRKSGFGKNRLSWTSDTGLTSGIVSQHLANEIMSLFDMDFSVDIQIDTAPKLPELAFKQRAKARLSQDMLTSLIPAFEKIAFENSKEKKMIDQARIVHSLPQRSSSLRHLEKNPPKVDVEPQYPLSPPATPVEKSLSHKKSLFKLASRVVTGKKGDESDNVSRKASTSTVASTSSSWSFVSESDRKAKPLPETPRYEEFKKPKIHAKKKRKSAVVMEKTMSKRKSNPPEKKLSKSKFIKLGSVNSKKTKKPLRDEDEKSKDTCSNSTQPSFVKRMASFMKSRKSKPVQSV